MKCPKCGANNRVPPARLHQRAKCGKCGDGVRVATPIALSEPEFDAFIRDASVPVLVDFWAPWCGPCRMVAPELEKLATQWAGSAVVAKVNTDDAPRVSAHHGISGIPTLILFRDGREATRLSGAMSADQIARRLRL